MILEYPKGNNDEALPVILHDGDFDLGHTISMEVARLASSEDDELVVKTQDLEVIFSSRWINIMHNGLYIFMETCELKAILKAHARRRDGRVLYF